MSTMEDIATSIRQQYPLCDRVFASVDGDSFRVWREWVHERESLRDIRKQPAQPAIRWGDRHPFGSGFWVTVRDVVIDGQTMPVTFAATFYEINGRVVAFYDSPSQVTDWRLVEQFRALVFPNEQHTTNETNFHNVWHAIVAANEADALALASK